MATTLPVDFPVYDNCTRANEDPLSGAGKWDAVDMYGDPIGFRLQSNQIQNKVGGWAGMMGTTIFDRGDGAIVAGFVLAGTPGFQFVYALDPTAEDLTGYAIRWEPGQTVRLINYTAADDTTIASVPAFALAAGDALALVAEQDGAVNAWSRISGTWNNWGTGTDTDWTALTPGWETPSNAHQVTTVYGGHPAVTPPPATARTRTLLGVGS